MVQIVHISIFSIMQLSDSRLDPARGIGHHANSDTVNGGSERVALLGVLSALEQRGSEPVGQAAGHSLKQQQPTTL